MHQAGAGTSGVDWSQTMKIGWSLLIGFGASALLLLVLKRVAGNPQPYAEPNPSAPPPFETEGN
jgi:PiT family inorganic phosphate transporter